MNNNNNNIYQNRVGLNFTGKVAVITGGASGIGEAVALLFSDLGAKSFVVDANPDALQKCESRNGSKLAGYLVLDVTNEEQVKQTLSKSLPKAADILVNSAGITGKTGIKSDAVSTADFRRVLEINLAGTFIMCKAVLPGMMAQKFGRIINIASIAGKDGNAGMVSYSASKAGVIGLTKAMGKEYATGFGNITINALAPAVIRTAMVAAMPPHQVKYMTDKIPMNRTGELDEIAAMVCFMCSEKASFTTGFCWDMTGGRSVY